MAIFRAVIFILRPRRQIRLLQYGLCRFEVVQIPHLHQITFAPNGVWIGIYRCLVGYANLHPLRIRWRTTQEEKNDEKKSCN